MDGSKKRELAIREKAIQRLQKNWGLITIVVTFIVICLLFVRTVGMQSIFSDGAGYYSYLPAVFIDHDLSMKTLFEETKNIATDYLERYAVDGSVPLYQNSYTVGVAVMETPFFLFVHLLASMTGIWPADGISWPYQMGVFAAQVFYACLGLFFTYKLLRKYYPEHVALFATAAIAFATGLIFYSAFGGSLSHAFSFSAIASFLFSSIQAHERGQLRYHWIVGVLLGLVTCCRVTNIVFVLFYVLYGINTWAAFKQKACDKKVYLQFLTGFLGFLAVFSLQMAYWKYAYGSFLTNSYGAGGTFSWLKPHILEILISAGRGLFIWHPIFVLAALGLPFVKEKMGIARLGIWFSVLAYVYVTAAWDCWWYGNSFGQRAFTDSLPMAAMLIAAAFTHFSECVSGNRRIFRKLALCVMAAIAVIHNLGFVVAYQLGLYPYQSEDMSSYSYAEFYQNMWPSNIGGINNKALFSGGIGKTKSVNLTYIPHSDSETENGLLSKGPEVLCFGPYARAYPGTYEIRVQYSAEGIEDGSYSVGQVTVGANYGKELLCVADMPANANSVELTAEFDSATDLVEVVVYVEREGILLQDYTVTRIE